MESIGVVKSDAIVVSVVSSDPQSRPSARPSPPTHTNTRLTDKLLFTFNAVYKYKHDEFVSGRDDIQYLM